MNVSYMAGISPGSSAWRQHESQLIGYRNGEALARHCDSAHKGAVSETCPACKEIQRKMLA
jgi:hypothetical protein